MNIKVILLFAVSLLWIDVCNAEEGYAYLGKTAQPPKPPFCDEGNNKFTLLADQKVNWIFGISGEYGGPFYIRHNDTEILLHQISPGKYDAKGTSEKLTKGKYEISCDRHNPGSYGIYYNLEPIKIEKPPKKINFGEVAQGEKDSQIVTIGVKNDIEGGLLLVLKLDNSVFELDNTGEILVEEGVISKSFYINFKTDNDTPVKTHTGKLSVTADGFIQTESIEIEGTVVPKIVVNPQILKMGKVVQTKTATADELLKIKNNSSKNLNFTTTPSDTFVHVSASKESIPAKGQATLKVTLAPTLDTPIGLYSSTLTISDADDKKNPSKSVTINADIIKAEPKISISRTALNLGKVVQTHSKDSNLIINNPGELPLTFNISSSNSLVSVTPTEGTINPAKELKVKVTFKPTQQTPAVPSNYTLSITHNASSPTSPLTIPVTATVAALTPPEIVVKPMELDFGSVAPQTTKKLIIYIDNEGTSDTVITASTNGKKTPDTKPKPNDYFKFLDNNRENNTIKLKVPGKDPLPLTVVFDAGKLSETTSISGIATITYTYEGSDKTILIPLTGKVVLQGFSLYLFFIPIAFLMIWLWLPRPWWDRIKTWVARRLE